MKAARNLAGRHRFLSDAAKTGCGVLLVGLGLGIYTRKSAALPIQALRPPGAGAESDFLGACIRCGLCVRACPYDTLNSSLTLDFLPLTDPFVLIQSWLAAYQFGSQAAIGALIIAVFYWLVGGRTYCSWVCPVNIITDTANGLRNRLGLRGNTRIHRNTRYWLLAASLLLAAVTGYVAWEWINPVSFLHRGIIFGMGTGWLIILAVFLFDLAVSRRGWCGHLCPVEAFYSLLGGHSPVRIRADNRDACDKCMDCFEVCPEPSVLTPALFGRHKGIGPVVNEANCTNCGRCIDVCSKQVFKFGTRFNNNESYCPVQTGPQILSNLKPEQYKHEEART